jgi:hypothetical protein
MKGLFYLLILVFAIAFACDTQSDELQPDLQKDSLDNKTKDGKYYELAVRPETTNNAIAATGNFHYAYLDTRVVSKATLLVFLGGTRSVPSQYHLFCRTAADMGYHVVNIDYPNLVPGTVCRDEGSDCYEHYHNEMWFGTDVSERIEIDESNSLTGRIVSLLSYLHNTEPDLGWDQYINGSDLQWEKLVIAGHSQGGGHSTYLGYQKMVNRIISFAAPNDYNEDTHHATNWLRTAPVTPLSKFYVLNHASDEIVSPGEQYQILKDMGLLNLGDTIHINQEKQFMTHALITTLSPNPEAEVGRLKHNSMIVDNVIPTSDRSIILSAWQFLLE